MVNKKSKPKVFANGYTYEQLVQIDEFNRQIRRDTKIMRVCLWVTASCFFVNVGFMLYKLIILTLT